LARYNPDGTLDTSFGGGSGKVHTLAPCFYAPYGRVGDVAIRQDGKIVGTVGMADGDGNCKNAGFLVRYHPDGSLDTSFGIDGAVSTSYGLWSVALQPTNEKIVTATGYYGETVARYNTNGLLDTSFGAGGIVTMPSGHFTSGDSVAFDPEGKIVVAGRTFRAVPEVDVFSVFRFTADGSFDTSFDGDGIVMTPPSPEHSFCTSVVIQTNGKILAAGSSRSDFALARYNANGSLDTTFAGGDGITTVDFNNSRDYAYDLELDNQGRAIVVGESDGRFAIARFLGDSIPMSGVNISGRVTTPSGAGVRNAVVSLTDTHGITQLATTGSFGFYSFVNIPPGGNLTVSISSRRYRFAPRTITADGNLTGVDFVGLE